jgi:hypothetical protein
MAVRDDIAQYISHFRARNQEIEKSCITYHVFGGVLYLVGIDTLSCAAFPQVAGNRRRVVQFIDRCSNWKDKDKVSAVQLKSILEEKGIRSGQLYDVINLRINSWGFGQIIRPDDDLTLGEVQHLATSNEIKYVQGARYAELLYTYRNSLLHESREPGRPVTIPADPSEPYYIGLNDFNQRSWELVFPVQFLESLCESCVNGLKAHLITNNLNPYDAYEFGTMWRRSR